MRAEADVVVVGGGPAGTWAALHARRAGARVVLLDKGWCGTSGATAPSGTGVWFVPPDEALREAEMASREQLGGMLAERPWMEWVLDHTYGAMAQLGTEGRYPYPRADDGTPIMRGVQGPEYLRRMRAWIQRVGVEIVDHAPALELLRTPDGEVCGVAGVRPRSGEAYRVTAGAVVLATGGCAFLAGALGTHTNTGDGHLMAAEVGAVMSGMEFSNAYAIAPRGCSVTKTAFYEFARFYRGDGSLIEGAGSSRGRSVLAAALMDAPAFARLDRADEPLRARMRLAQPNFFLPFDRRGIDPFRDLFEVTLLAEGTVRGTGGVRVAGSDCGTDVSGLYVAGDVATREPICGGFTGGGSRNAAWAISTGAWAGAAAAAHARDRVGAGSPATVAAVAEPAGRVALRPTARPHLTAVDVLAPAQEELLPLERNHRRDARGLTRSAEVLDDLWSSAAERLGAVGARDLVRAREAAAITAVGRWMYRSAAARTESRGMARRTDHPELDPTQRHRLLSGGLDEVWVRREGIAA